MSAWTTSVCEGREKEREFGRNEKTPPKICQYIFNPAVNDPKKCMGMLRWRLQASRTLPFCKGCVKHLLKVKEYVLTHKHANSFRLESLSCKLNNQ